MIAVSGTPIPQGSKQAYRTGDRIYLVEANKAVYEWRERIAKAAREYMEHIGIFEQPIHLELVFLMPRPKTVTREHPTTKPDLDKLVRAVNDAITGIIFKDDSQVVKITASKQYAKYGMTGVIIQPHVCNDSITYTEYLKLHADRLGQ